MFRKKKTLGNVVVYDEDDGCSQGDKHGVPVDDFQRRGDPRAQNLAADDLERMSASELESLALSTAEEGKEGTSRALAMALETRQIGVATAETMKKQTEQLERMGDNIEIVHDYLDKSDRVIDKMSKPKIVRMFQRQKPMGKGLKNVKAGRKDIAEREKLRQNGLDSVDLKSMQKPDEDELACTFDSVVDREELLGDSQDSEKKGRQSKKKTSSAPQNSRAIKEDYSGYSSGVAQVLKQQDDDLDKISDALADMNALAKGMNSELDYQEKLINEVQNFTEETSIRTKEHARRVNRIK